jgi:hypothetical protein
VNVRSAVTARTFLTPRWIGLHLVFWGAAVGMVFLGRWQLQVSDRKHFDLQNFSYVIQWWFFAAATLWFWGRLIHDRIRPPVTTAPGSGLAVQTGSTGLVPYMGPADLVAPDRGDGSAPVVYRGYAMPHSAITPARSDDRYHGEYNDYLWQLSLADQEKERAKAARNAPPATDGPREAVTEPAALEGSELPDDVDH